MSGYITVFCTVPDDSAAVKISERLVGEGLVACVNILPGVKSVYKWKGEVCRSGELLLIMKSRSEIFDKIKKEITGLHPYEVPEIISVDISDGNEPYLRWIDEYTEK